MKETFSQERSLPAFRIDLEALKALFHKLQPQFPEGIEFFRFEVRLGKRELVFQSLEELNDTNRLPNVIGDFSLAINHGAKWFRMRVGFGFSGFAKVSADAPDEAWCFGTVEVARSFIGAYRRWYAPLVGWPLTAAAFLLGPVISYFGASDELPRIALASLFIAWLAIMALWLFKAQLLPLTQIVVRPQDSILRKYLPELTLAIAVVGLLAAFAQLAVALRAAPSTGQASETTDKAAVPTTKK